MLETCAAINPALQAFTNAFDSFKKGSTAANIKRLLSFRAPNFVAALKDVAVASETKFAVPAPPKQILGKRTPP